MPRDRLDTWKAIAAHVGRDVRTVLRWHKDRGLPVHRVPGGKGRSVFAYADELDAWMAGEARTGGDRESGNGQREPGRARQRAPFVVPASAALLTVLIVTAAALVARGAATGEPVEVAVVGKSLIAFDAARREVWRVPLPHSASLTARGPSFVDLDADGRREILVPLTLSEPSGTVGGVLYCFEAKGRLRWSRAIADTIRFGAGEFGPPWSSADIAVIRRGSSVAIAYAVTHSVWWPSIVALLDARGEITGRFIHAGWITRLAAGADGTVLLAGGVSNARDASILAVLEGDGAFTGAWGETAAEYRCDCPSVRVAKYFVFPRSEANRSAGQLALRQSIEVQADGSLLVRVPQRGDLPADALYEFSPSFDLRRAAFADLYWDWHRQLEAAGVLDHTRRDCPARTPSFTAAASPLS
ncbi:MAG TPA: hypothetical protein VFK57_22535 [Vicinamibacterales bacterium]|nr:hypothetical protein [Vicinamibacterales bacterium]